MALATDSQSGVFSGRRRVYCSGRRCGVEGRAAEEEIAGWWQMATTDASRSSQQPCVSVFFGTARPYESLPEVPVWTWSRKKAAEKTPGKEPQDQAF